MTRFRDLPIQRKLRLAILMTCTVSLVVACGTLFALQFVLLRKNFVQEVEAAARILAKTSATIVALERADEATELLASLKDNPSFSGAVITLTNGHTLASYGELHNNGNGFTSGMTVDLDGHDLLCSQPILLNGRQVGTLALHADYSSRANALLQVYAGLLAGVLTLSFLVAVFISWRLEPVILGPIKRLADAARRIAGESDYSVRVERSVDDEVGSFTESFNAMVGQIQQRDTALRHEISERRNAESELQKLHVQLVDASRHAGMAEVATGVLHNVGNVLNSVNVSANLIAERLNQSKLSNLARAAQLLRDQNGSLTEFLTNDPKGRLLPSYLVEASQHLETERVATLGELDHLTRNIEHIKDIVSRQQSYAQVAGILETLPVPDLLEDALRLNLDSLARHGITIERKFQSGPPMTVDKHQVLQILVNLIRNAKQAIDDGPGKDRRLTLTIEHHLNAAVVIKVADTGMGIPAENLTKIFSHGFTTRKGGHGFGLHSSALTAKQLGGNITAQSSGAGHGATFILELPLKPLPAVPAAKS